MLARVCIVAAMLAAPLPAVAETDEARFHIQDVRGGFMRLDRTTGAVELCRGDANEGVECETVVTAVGEGAAGTIAELRAENEALRAELAVLKATLARIAELAAPMASDDESEPLITSTTRRDIDRALEVTDTALRTFRDLFKGLQDIPSGQ